ncbi:AraC family transcriptional regulator [Terrimonas sp. NA20]|uniref:AraC family transcriptional regulator n=1 Tax=Terrimonas ginsenosidimutans TaxID=2908004 RepID=A0ABS9KU70_9BACT|nr:helix-turn-helix domain-containing protein [Terrimonas ginsenosidimutans]MCG2615875.1 AraC family transcriptional regulator [Terrimonas ginsenosidimutans]
MKKKQPVERDIIDFRRSGWNDIMLLGKYNYKQAHEELPPHSHRQTLEICYCSKGEQIYEVNGTLYKIKGGDLFVTFPGEVHSTGKYPEEKGELYWMMIRIPTGKTKQSFLQYDLTLASEWHKRLLNLPRHFRGNNHLRLLLEEIFRVHKSAKTALRQIELRHSIASFLLEVISAARTPVLSRQTGRMEKIDSFIKEKIDEPVVLDEVAKLVGLSLSRFKAWFKEETGTTPLDYVLKYKIRTACEWLSKPDRSIADIAFETGFQNQQYFSTVFKKYMGMSPGEYRKDANIH